jgi:hypothetical protein
MQVSPDFTWGGNICWTISDAPLNATTWRTIPIAPNDGGKGQTRLKLVEDCLDFTLYNLAYRQGSEYQSACLLGLAVWRADHKPYNFILTLNSLHTNTYFTSHSRTSYLALSSDTRNMLFSSVWYLQSIHIESEANVLGSSDFPKPLSCQI